MNTNPFEQMRHPQRTLESLQRELTLLSPDFAQWWAYGVSHNWFMLRLGVTRSDALMIGLFGCRELSGLTAWNDPVIHCHLELAATNHPHNQWELTDANVGFRAIGHGLYFGKNVSWDDDWYAGHFRPEDFPDTDTWPPTCSNGSEETSAGRTRHW